MKSNIYFILLSVFLTTSVGAQLRWKTNFISETYAIWTSSVYGNATFVAVSKNGEGTGAMTSSDGLIWTFRTAAANNDWSSVTYGNDLFVAVSNSGIGNRIMTSPDGITWTSRTSAADENWQSITYGNGMFVAVASSGTGNRVMTSSDGINWVSRSSASDNDWKSVVYGNGMFVAVSSTGSSDRVMTSTDGITWTSRFCAYDLQWQSITYGEGLFVAVANDGDGNRIMTSTNGIDWTNRNSPMDIPWSSVTYGNGYFVSVAETADYAPVMYSEDGVSWTQVWPGYNAYWKSISYGNGIFIAFNSEEDTGYMLSSDFTLLTSTIASSITTNSAIAGGTITYAGLQRNENYEIVPQDIIARGVCWSTTSNPTIADSKTTDGTGIGSFTSSLTGLTANTIYYYRAYTTTTYYDRNSETTYSSTNYGENMRFLTSTEAECPNLTVDFSTTPDYSDGDNYYYTNNFSIRRYTNGNNDSSHDNGQYGGGFYVSNCHCSSGFDPTYETNLETNIIRSSPYILKTITVKVITNSINYYFIGLGPNSTYIGDFMVDLTTNGTYGSGNESITVSYDADSKLALLTFGSGWFNITETIFKSRTAENALTEVLIKNLVFTECVTYVASGPTTFQSTTTGAWSSSGSWVSNAVPTSTDHVQVNDSHTISISENTTIDNLILKSGGTITVTGSAVLTIDGDLQDEGGSFSVETGSSVLLKGNILNNQGTIKVSNTSTNGMEIKGNVDVEQGNDG
jgi:hypothetical protein